MLVQRRVVNDTIDVMNWIQRSGLLLGVFPALEAAAPELRAWWTSRRGGASAQPYDDLNLGLGTGDRPEHVHGNRRRLLRALDISPENVACGSQVHGSRIAIVHEGGNRRGTDGFITTARGLALVISTADCYPVAVYAPSEKVLAALHVGRKGAALGIIRKTVDMMVKRYSIDTCGALALIGPGICRKCYAVYPRTAALYSEKHIKRYNNEYHLDLRSHCRDQLIESGLKRRNIFQADLCTSCNPHLFYSHRRDGAKTGRHWMLAMIGPSP